MLDWLKVLVGSKSAAKPKESSERILQVDSHRYPIVKIGPKGLTASNMDENLIVGQRAQVTVQVKDRFGQFTFPAKITIDSKTAQGQFDCSWVMLSPEVEQVLAHYARNAKAGAAPAPASTPPKKK